MSDVPNRPEADDEWEQLLRQLRARPAPQPRPFFYARVRARLDATLARPPLPVWLRWPAYAALGLLMLALSGDNPATGAAATPDSPPTTRPGR